SYDVVTASIENAVATVALPDNLLAITKAALRASVATDQHEAATSRENAKAALREQVNQGKADGGQTPVTAANVLHVAERARGDFDEALHPRGRDGKFITKGGRVVVHGNGKDVE